MACFCMDSVKIRTFFRSRLSRSSAILGRYKFDYRPSPPRSRMSKTPTLGDTQISPDTSNVLLSIARICPTPPVGARH